MTLASVAVPFCDERGHVLSGKRVLRLWTNRHDVMTMPPGEASNPVSVGRSGDGGVELHVEFDSFAGSVATAPLPSLWALSHTLSALTECAGCTDDGACAGRRVGDLGRRGAAGRRRGRCRRRHR